MSSTAAPRSGPSTQGSLGGRLQHARQRGFVGRRRELAVFRRSLDGAEGAPRVLLVHGPGGIGKSTLLDRMAYDATRSGRRVVRVDGRRLTDVGPPAPPGAPVQVAPAATPHEVAAELLGHAAEAAVHEPHLVLVDSLERCEGLEGLLRHELLPRLPEETLVVLAGRLSPQPDWTIDPGWRELVGVIRLDPLDEDQAAELVDSRGVPAAARAHVLGFAAGNPLALTLAADDVEAHGTGWLPGPDFATVMLGRIVDPQWQVEHAAALAVCAQSRHTTVELLRTVLDPDRAVDEFTWLSSLACVRPGPTGLQLDRLTERLLDAVHRWQDPTGHEELRRVLWGFHTERALAGSADSQDAVRELVHLSRRAHAAATARTEEPCPPVELDLGDDLAPTVLALAEEALGSAALPQVRHWLARQPEAFTVFGGADDQAPVSFLAWLRLTQPDEVDTAADPVVAEVWRHAEQHHRWRPGDEVAVVRFLASRPPSAGLPVSDPRLLRWHGQIVRSARRLASSYVAVTDREAWSSCLAGLDHHPCATSGPVEDGAGDWALFEHDWHRVPLAAYLDRVFPATARAHDEPVDHRPPVLTREAFDEALRQLLRQWHDDDAVAANPLTTAAPGEPGVDPVTRMRVLVTATITAMQDEPRHLKHARALAATYVHAGATQEAAAARLGVPFGTFRRHLAKGTSLLADRLWHRFDHPTAPAHPLTSSTPPSITPVGLRPDGAREDAGQPREAGSSA